MDDDEEEIRPRRKSRSRKKKQGMPAIAIVAIVLGVVTLLGIGGLLIVRKLNRDPGNTVANGTVAQNQSSNNRSGSKYIPRESEEKFQKFMKTLTEEQIRELTEEDVFKYMGEPTRREQTKTVNKNGQTLSYYTAHWDVPGSGIRSQILFMNGRANGMAIGVETK